MQDSPPPTKRIKLESPPPESPHSNCELSLEKEGEEDVDDQCSICLQPLSDRTLIPRCSHEFCFECLVIWTDQSRRCPLCSQGIGEHLIHNIRSKYDYTKYFLPPLRANSPALASAGPSSSNQRRPTRRERRWGQRGRRDQELQDQLERSIKKRKWVYRHHLYAKHVASNVHTRYRPFPTPAQFAASPDYISRATSFLRRELQVWPNLDIEFLTTFTLSIMKSLDIRSESAVKLLSEFLDMDQPYLEGNPHPNAEHLAHEMYSYLRSPFRDLYVYDKMVLYDEPEDPASHRQQQRSNVERGLPSSPSRRNGSRPGRPDGNHGDGWRQGTRGASHERRRKRSRSRSHDRERIQRLRRPSVDEHTSQRAQSDSQTHTSSSGLSPPAPHSQVVKGKGKGVDLGKISNDVGPSTNTDKVGRMSIDKGVGNAPAREHPNAEHTVIDNSKPGNRDRTPKALTLRQSVWAHLSLNQTEPTQVSRTPAGSGPDLRHGRPSLLERISGMEDLPQSQLVSVSTVHLGTSAGTDPARPPRSPTVQPRKSGAAHDDINPTDEGTIDIDKHHSDPISNLIRRDNPTAQAERHDRASRVNTKVILECTRTIRLAAAEKVMVAGIPATATPPSIPQDPLTSAEQGEATHPASVVTVLRNKLLERLENERERAIGAASGELGAEPVPGNISEDSLRAELRARNELRTRLAVVNGGRHVGNLEP